MAPEADERLARIAEVTEGALRYYLTAYLRVDEREEHTIKQRDLLMAYAMQAANVQALLEADEVDDRSMLAHRHEVVRRYVDEVRENPWSLRVSQVRNSAHDTELARVAAAAPCGSS